MSNGRDFQRATTGEAQLPITLSLEWGTTIKPSSGPQILAKWPQWFFRRLYRALNRITRSSNYSFWIWREVNVEKLGSLSIFRQKLNVWLNCLHENSRWCLENDFFSPWQEAWAMQTASTPGEDPVDHHKPVDEPWIWMLNFQPASLCMKGVINVS